MISNRIEFKNWLEKIIFKHDYSDLIFHEFFEEKFFNAMIWDDLVEHINQVQLDDIKILGNTPEFLSEYYCINRAIINSLTDTEYLNLRDKIMKIIFVDKKFNKLYSEYSEFENQIESSS